MNLLHNLGLEQDLHLAVSALGIPYGKDVTVCIKAEANPKKGGMSLCFEQSDSPYDVYQLLIDSAVTSEFDINKADPKSCAYATNGSYALKALDKQSKVIANKAIQSISKQLQYILETTEFKRLFKALNLTSSSFESLCVSRYGVKITILSANSTRLTINNYFNSHSVSAIELVSSGYNHFLGADDIAQISGSGSAMIRFAVRKITMALEGIGKLISGK